jgi:hypothetical protein
MYSLVCETSDYSITQTFYNVEMNLTHGTSDIRQIKVKQLTDDC